MSTQTVLKMFTTFIQPPPFRAILHQHVWLMFCSYWIYYLNIIQKIH